ncbi:hypothetical protein HU200_027645 [Digitaria exilis]|uniref:Probable purine permease n=1 Tax=Digitaria exilis TaxID=1010633 RepID=A0A835BTW8_9POAL|nr:hypothetical protein HU200_027645 [Digitaria exilis]
MATAPDLRSSSTASMKVASIGRRSGVGWMRPVVPILLVMYGLEAEGSMCKTGDALVVGGPESATPAPQKRRHSIRWWALVLLDMAMLLGGQTATILLCRLYFNSGGRSAWLLTLAHSAGAPLLAAPLLLTPRAAAGDGEPTRPPAWPATMAAICTGLGVLVALDNAMFVYAELYLPVSTFSLLAATQLAFNAVTSRLINAQRLTALTLNSVVVLTFSAALLGVGSGSDETSSYVPRGKYAAGFALTLAAAAGYALVLSLFEVTFERLLRTRTLRWVLKLQIYTNVAGSAVAVALLLATGEGRKVRGEAEGYRDGRGGYAATLVGIAVAWQVATLGMVRLITRASSLFANVTSTLGLPLVPIFAVPLFGDKMTGIKVVAMLMAVWGFLSYVYQHYLDDRRRAAAGKERTPVGSGGICVHADVELAGSCARVRALPIGDSGVAEQGTSRV